MINLRTRITFLVFAIFAGTAVWLGLSTASTAGGDAMKLAWSVETDKPISIAPVISGNTVMVVPKGRPLFAFNVADGSTLWSYDPDRTIWNRSLASDGSRAFICMRGGDIAAIDISSGKQIWQTSLGIECQRQPHISGNTIYVSTTFVGPGIEGDTYTGAKLFSINLKNGIINWSFKTDTYLLQTAFRNGDTVYVGGSYRDPEFDNEEGGPIRFYALNSKTGKSSWIYEAQDGLPKALYATDERLIYVGYEDFLIGVDTTSGKKVWRRDTGNWVPSLAGIGDVVYYGAANTKVHAWDTLTGKPHWKFNIPGGSFNYLLGTPVFDDGKMYFMSQRGTVFVLDLDDGEEIWSQPTGMKARTGLSISGGKLFMGDSSGRVYAYDILK